MEELRHNIIKRVYSDITTNGEISLSTIIIVTSYMMGDYNRAKELLNKKVK